MKFIYDKNHAIVSRANSRADTSNSHISEKKLTKEYVGQLYEYGIEKVFSYICIFIAFNTNFYSLMNLKAKMKIKQV